jgi:hypothetical protein
VLVGKVGHVKHYGWVWYDLDGIAKILSLHHMRSTHLVAYNTWIGVHKDDIIVHAQIWHMCFQNNGFGLYYTDATNLSV